MLRLNKDPDQLKPTKMTAYSKWKSTIMRNAKQYKVKLPVAYNRMTKQHWNDLQEKINHKGGPNPIEMVIAKTTYVKELKKLLKKQNILPKFSTTKKKLTESEITTAQNELASIGYKSAIKSRSVNPSTVEKLDLEKVKENRARLNRAWVDNSKRDAERKFRPRNPEERVWYDGAAIREVLMKRINEHIDARRDDAKIMDVSEFLAPALKEGLDKLLEYDSSNIDSAGYKISILIGDKYEWGLRDANILKIMGYMEGIQTGLKPESISDEELVDDAVSKMLRENVEGFISIWIKKKPIGAQGARQNAFYNFVLPEDFPVNLSHLQIFKQSQIGKNTYNDDCIINSLREEGVSDDKLSNLKFMRYHAGTVYMKSNKLAIIAQELKSEIRVMASRKDGFVYTQKYQPKNSGSENKVIELASHQNHMIPNSKDCGMTRFAITNYKEIHKMPGWKSFTRMKLDKHRVPKYYSKNPKFVSNFTLVKMLDKIVLPLKKTDALMKTQEHGRIKGVVECPTNITEAHYEDVVDPGLADGLIFIEAEGDNHFYGTLKDVNTGIVYRQNIDKKFIKGPLDKVLKSSKKEGQIIKRDILVDGQRIPISFMVDKTVKYIQRPKIIHYTWDVETNTKKLEGSAHEMILGRLLCHESKVSIRINTPEQLLNAMLKTPTNSIFIAQNAAYDFAQIAKHPEVTISEGIWSGPSSMKFQIIYYKGREFYIKDSLSIIPSALADYGQMFNLKVQKEIMPYNVYTTENCERGWASIRECKKALKPYLRKGFVKNCREWNCIKGNQVNIMEYCDRYCAIDCEVLALGYMTFREWILKYFNLDIDHYISLPQIAYSVMYNYGVFKDVKAVAGEVQAYIQQCVRGGRCMAKNNERQFVSGERVQDFDAVSLYPSAMMRMMGLPIGPPMVIKDFNEDVRGKRFFITARVLKVGKRRQFPLVSVKGITNDWTNDLEGKIVHIDRNTYEDCIEFQKMEFEFIEGVYFENPTNERLKECMEDLFEKRIDLKKAKNPAQVIMKLIMNASYGRLIMKPINTETKHIYGKEEIKKFIIKNENFIKGPIIYLNVAQTAAKIITKKSIMTHKNIVHAGVEVLSMSKRIMSEVMCLAEDLDIDIFYQDTDSMHIQENDIYLLQQEFQKKYDRELIGKEPGQFHIDFADPTNKKFEDLHAIDSVFISKKVYVDRLKYKVLKTLPNGKVKKISKQTYHIRGKGVSTEAIYRRAAECKLTVLQLYKELYNGVIHKFNLVSEHYVKFKATSGYDYLTLGVFNRSLRATAKVPEVSSVISKYFD